MIEQFTTIQRARDLYQFCKKLKLPEHLYNQLVRASSSVALNLGEGLGKRTAADKKRYYFNALGSLRECEVILFIEGVDHPELKRCMDDLGAMLFSMSRK